jgi:hypothetical protein
MSPKKLSFIGQIEANGSCIIPIQSIGDLLTGVWLEGPVGLTKKLVGTRFDLYIGGQMIDSQTTDYMAEIWQAFLPETQAKSDTWNNLISTTNDTFFPLHFFFCDNDMFLPILALQYHPIEIRVQWGKDVTPSSVTSIYGNFVYLDTNDREEFTKRPLDILVTQVQRTIASQPKNLDLSVFNHPVKAIFFGVPLPQSGTPAGFTFDSADILINGTYLLEQMSPTYFYSAQVYYHTRHGVTTFDATNHTPLYTQYFMYSFAKDASSYRPTGSCNFSRLDNAKVNVVNPNVSQLTVYAVNYNVLRIEKGLGGILFGN